MRDRAAVWAYFSSLDASNRSSPDSAGFICKCSCSCNMLYNCAYFVISSLQYRVLVPLHGHGWRWRPVHVWVGVFLRGTVWEDGKDGHRTSALPGFALPDARPGQTWESRLVPVLAHLVFLFIGKPLSFLPCCLNLTRVYVFVYVLFSPGKITLGDLKRCRMAHIFFDTFFNLEKYLDHEQRDPFAVQKVWICIWYV